MNNNETRTPETGLAIPDDMALAKVPRSDVVALLLDTAGTLETTEEQRAVLFAAVDPDLVEIREDGIVYLPAVEFKQILCEVFGTSWAIIPESPKPVEVDGVILWGFHLFIQGQPVAFAWGEQRYKMGDWGMSYGDAMEGAKSNAIMRLCKQIGIAIDLWRPSFIRKWKRDNAVEYEGYDKSGKRKMLWKRNPDAERAEPDEQSDETDESQEEERATVDTDRFRRTAFLIVEYLKIDEVRMKAECKEMFGVDSRANMPPEQWSEYRDYLKSNMDTNQIIDYERWLEVRSAIKSLTERGMDKKELKFYLQTHYLRLDVVDSDLPEDLPQRLERSGASDKYYASLQKRVQRTKEWAEAIGGQGKAEELLDHLQSVLDDTTNTGSLAEFFKNLGIDPQSDGEYRLTDISPAVFGGWKGALGVQDNQPKPEPEDAAGDTEQGDTPPETAEGQERSEDSPEWDITSKTRREIGELLGKLKIYKGPRSPEFKARIKKLIGRELLKMQSMMEAEGQAIIASLSEELVMVGTSPDGDEEELEDGMLTPADAKDEAFAQAYAASEREVERVASGEPPFQTTPEWAELNKKFNTRLYEHFHATQAPVFKSPDYQLEWSAKTTGVASTGQWLPEHFSLANAGLDVIGTADAEIPEQTGTSPAPEKPANGLCTDDDFKELSELFKKLLPDKEYAMGSKEARDLIRDSKAVKGMFTKIKSLTTEEISDLKHYLNDLITDMKADAAERVQNAKDAV